jgi:hypothetical protein
LPCHAIFAEPPPLRTPIYDAICHFFASADDDFRYDFQLFSPRQLIRHAASRHYFQHYWLASPRHFITG